MEKKLIKIANPILTDSIIEKVNAVLASRFWAQGSYVKQLEEQCAKVAGTKYAVAVSSGTAALHTLLSAYNFQKGDEIITTPFTFAATTNVILLIGATPVYADIDPQTFNSNPKDIEKKITKKTKAIFVVDLFGQLADYTELTKIAKKHNLLLLSDSSQAIGALHKNKPIGSYVTAATFSLYATKNIAAGEGGMIVTNDKKVAEFCQAFRNQGLQNGLPGMVGLNYRLTDILAVIAVEQMHMVQKISTKRRTLAAFYTKALQNVRGIVLPTIDSDNESVFHQYTIRVTKDAKLSREEIKSMLLKKQIETNAFYPYVLHLVPQTKHLQYKKGDLPNAEQATKEVLSLPMNYSLTKKEQQYIVEEIKKLL